MNNPRTASRASACDFVRVALVLPAALAAVIAVQFAAEQGVASTMLAAGVERDWVDWISRSARSLPARALTSALTGATFVATVMWIVPPVGRRAVLIGLYTLAALCLVIAVAVLARDWPSVDYRLALFVPSGLCGGGAVYWLAQR